MLVFLLPSGSAAANPILQASVGPGFTITLKDANGANVKHLDTGTYDVHVVDQGVEHNFHLEGPNVEEATSVEDTGEVTWTVTFIDGVYHFQCDAHPTQMKGDFAVGTATIEPPPPPAAAPAAALRVREGDEAQGHGWPWLHHLAEGRRPQDRPQGARREDLHHLHHGQVRHPQLPPHGEGREQEDLRRQVAEGDLEGQVQERHVPLSLRFPSNCHEGKLQGLISCEAEEKSRPA